MDSLLDSFESLWHYGLPTLHTSAPNLTGTASPPVGNYESSARSLQSLFSVMDEDCDGRLSLCEMRSLLAKLHISSQSTGDLHCFMELYTESTHIDDGFSLDFPQFTLLYASLFDALHYSSTQYQDHDDDELLDAFHVYDTNHDGFISAAELAAVLLELGLLPEGCGINAHLGTCQAYIDSVDLDGDGMVDLNEFKSMMTRNQQCLSTCRISSSSICNIAAPCQA